MKSMETRILLRRDTSANWESNNPILSAGEVGIDLTINNLKVGDGISTWINLPYFTQGIAGIFLQNDFDAQIAGIGGVGLSWNTNEGVYDVIIASKFEAEQGTAENVLMTPLRTFEAIDARSSAILTDGNYVNQGDLNSAVASLGGTGLLWNTNTLSYDLDFADNSTTLDGISTTTVMSPRRTAEMIEDRTLDIDGGDF